MGFRVGNRQIGPGNPVFIIAEVGNNHGGDLGLAKACVLHAAKAGADAVSFQYAPIQSYVTKDMYADPRVAFLSECEFTPEQLAELGGLARSHNLAFSINVEDDVRLDQVVQIGMDFIKLCSADLTNVPFLRYCAGKGLPIFFSTGGAYMEEIETAWQTLKVAGMSDYVVFHTNSGYPTPLNDANIVQMDLLHERFGGVKGYCDHTCDVIPPVVAASRGAGVIEKHITTSRALRGDDWMVSLEPEEFARMVNYVRRAEQCLGIADKKPLACEEQTRIFKRKSIVARRGIKKGETIGWDMLCYKIPGTAGITPVRADELIGRIAACDMEAEMLIRPEMIEGFA